MNPSATKSHRGRRIAPRVLALWGGLLAVVGTARPVVAAWGTHGMVASEHRLASAAGVEVLRQGGNAVDAAAATALAVCVTNPSSCGVGGGGFMVIYLAHQRRAYSLDYRETAPHGATRDMFVRDGKVIPELSRQGGLAVAVPGEIAGVAEAVRRFGKLTLRQVMQPAIRLARNGFPIEAHLAEEIERSAPRIRKVPALARNFLRADGTPLIVGERLRQPELAESLSTIARQGPRAFYRGRIAEQIASSVQASGGIMKASDLAGFRPTWRAPLVGAYRGHEVYTMPPPSSGGGVLLEALGILRDDPLVRLGYNSSAYSHLVVEAMKHSFADRARFYGDPDFVSVPVDLLLSPGNLRDLRARLRFDATLERSAYGSSTEHRSAAGDGGTSHLSVVDAEGNAVACTTTLNTGFGAMVVAGDTGIILNNEMDDFSAQPGTPNIYGLIGAEANAIAPGKRPLSSMTPTIVTRDGRVVLTLGGSGGPLIISGTLQVLLNVVDFNLSASNAVAGARLHDQWTPPVVAVEPGVSPNVRDDLVTYGHPVKEVATMGAIQAVRVYQDILEGASDPRKGGEAAGW